MVWTADYLSLDPGATTQDPILIVAGPKGATLLVWGVALEVGALGLQRESTGHLSA